MEEDLSRIIQHEDATSGSEACELQISGSWKIMLDVITV